MTTKKNIVLLSGGGGSEHEISQISAKHIFNSIKDNYNITQLEMSGAGTFVDLNSNKEATFTSAGILLIENKEVEYQYVIPCFHGYPGESGEISAFFELIGKEFLGQQCEQSTICFNKITTKLWLSALGIKNTPYIIIKDLTDLDLAVSTFDEWGSCFIKASNQGSSVGCFKVTKSSDLKNSIEEAFQYSDFVLMEKVLTGRELEVAVYEYEGKLIASEPGEIILNEEGFYSYEEKYSNDSVAKTIITANELPTHLISRIKENSLRAFTGLKLRHLSRIDFFYASDGELYLNEINTFPGLTPISMFPKMMEAKGHSFNKFLTYIINEESEQ